MSSAAGKAASAAGCAQNEETESVDAQQNAATPPGTRPVRAHGWPPVPGQPLPKCLPPTTMTTSPARNSADGTARPPGPAAGEPRRHGPRHRQRGEQRQHGEDQDRPGHHERGHGGARGVRRGPLPADDELGPDGAADTEEDGRAAGERGQAGPGLRAGQLRDLRRAAAQPGVGEPGDEAAPDHVRRARRRPRPLGEVGHQQLGELLAVAGPPGPRVPGAGWRRPERSSAGPPRLPVTSASGPCSAPAPTLAWSPFPGRADPEAGSPHRLHVGAIGWKRGSVC